MRFIPYDKGAVENGIHTPFFKPLSCYDTGFWIQRPVSFLIIVYFIIYLIVEFIIVEYSLSPHFKRGTLSSRFRIIMCIEIHTVHNTLPGKIVDHDIESSLFSRILDVINPDRCEGSTFIVLP